MSLAKRDIKPNKEEGIIFLSSIEGVYNLKERLYTPI
jgi:hypothetical protein